MTRQKVLRVNPEEEEHPVKAGRKFWKKGIVETAEECPF